MSTSSGSLIENIYAPLVFRDRAAFAIPKAIREKGYIQSLDLRIDSIAWSQYENGKSLPPIQFYGYAQLVLQDYCSLEIPIHFPRQRIWHYRVESALSQWRDIHTWHNGHLEWFEWFFRFFTQGEEEAPPLPPIEYPDTNFIESPLREVYIKCPSGTQFEVEISQWEPVPFVGRRGKTYDGKSNQVDGDKDGGLPSGGFQPKKNSPDNPFSGNRSPSSLSFESGFFVDEDKLDDVNGDSALDIPATPDSEGFYMEYSYPICSIYQVSLPSQPVRTLLRTAYAPCSRNSVVEVTRVYPLPNGTPNGCAPVEFRDWIITETPFVEIGAPVISSGSINGVVQFGILPTGVVISQI